MIDRLYLEEIKQSFKLFDRRRIGSITPNSFKLLLRAQGFRVTTQEVWKEIVKGNKRLGRRTPSEDVQVDMELALEVIQESYNKKFEPDTEMKKNFRLFDEANKGYIDEHDLKRVIVELKNEGKKMGLNEDDIPSSLGDDQIRAMIEEFDSDLDSVINFNDFRKIMAFS